jgi:hypothetical protein
MQPAVVVLALFVSCAHAAEPFVQSSIRIVPPVHETGPNHTLIVDCFNDGGTKMIKIRDATGKDFEVYFDHRIGSKTPGAIYLFAYPGKPHSVRVLNQRDFLRKIHVSEHLDLTKR